MPSADNALLRYEAGQNPTAFSALTDSGDRTTFNGSSSPWSKRTGFVPVIRPDGLLTGGAVTPAASGTNNLVDVGAGTAYINGALVSFDAEEGLAITRDATDGYLVSSIVVSSAGVVTVEAGDAHASAFSEVRAAAGGPPLIPVGSIELAQVRTTAVSASAAPIGAGEVYSVIGVHTERSDYPVWDVDYYNGRVTFVDDLPAIHVGTLPKGVFASYAAPIFADVSIASDFVPPENSYSVSSTQVYGRTLGSTSTSLSAGSFTAYLENGVTDPLVGLQGEELWFQFFPNRYQTQHIVCQGRLGVTRTFPADDSISAACTINAASAATNVAA